MKTTALLIITLLLVSCNNSEKNKLSKDVITDLQYSVYEVVVPKIEDPNIKYEKELPFDTLPFQERSDKFHSIGTAFFISEKEVASAAHVFNVPFFSLYKDYFLRNSKGELFEVGNVTKYSQHKDLIIFTLKKYPSKIIPLEFKEDSEVGDNVFTVGNAQGEGISFREGQIASYTPEVIDGEWKDIRFSSPASPGNSGGPLITSSGKVIGVIVKKNVTENYNYAVPVNLLNKLSSKKAEFLMKNEGFAIFHASNIVLKDWRETIDLPRSLQSLKDLSQDSMDSFMNNVFKLADKKFENQNVPKGKAFNLYSRNPTYIRGFGALRTDVNFSSWQISSYEYREVVLSETSKGWFSKSDVAQVHALIQKPASMKHLDFLRNQKVFMEEMIKVVPLTRQMSNQGIKITSLGEPFSTEIITDNLGRPWITSTWFLPWADHHVVTYCLPHPGGAICNLDSKSNLLLKRGRLDPIKSNLSEITVGYEGSIKDWVEYFSLPKEMLPKYLATTNVSFVDHKIIFTSDDFKIKYKDKNLSLSSDIHLHMGYSTNGEWGEQLLMAEIFPEKGAKEMHFRVNKLFAAQEGNTTEYKNQWSEMIRNDGLYSGKLMLDSGSLKARHVKRGLKRNMASQSEEEIFVIGCNFASHANKTKSTLRCEQFKKSVEF